MTDPPVARPAPQLRITGLRTYTPLVFRHLRFEVMVMEGRTTLSIYDKDGRSLIYEEQVPGGKWAFDIELPP